MSLIRLNSSSQLRVEEFPRENDQIDIPWIAAKSSENYEMIIFKFHWYHDSDDDQMSIRRDRGLVPERNARKRMTVRQLLVQPK